VINPQAAVGTNALALLLCCLARPACLSERATNLAALPMSAGTTETTTTPMSTG
jgi:hypothetical protein